MDAPSRFLNKSKSEDIFKEVSGLDRFDSEVWSHIEQLCFDYFIELAKKTGERVRAEGRTVIEVADVRPLEGSGLSTPTPEALMERLHAMADADVSQVARFGKLISSWVEEQKAKSL